MFLQAGRIVERGSHSKLLQLPDGQYVHMLSFDQTQKNDMKQEDKAGDEKDTDAASEKNLRQDSVVSGDNTANPVTEVLMSSNENNPKNAGCSVLLKYFKVRITTHPYRFSPAAW